MGLTNFEQAVRQIRSAEVLLGQPVLTPEQWGRLAVSKNEELDKMDLVDAVLYLEGLKVPREMIRSYIVRRPT